MKKFKPMFTVVISSTDNENDVFIKFANEKYFAELPLNIYEVCAIINESKVAAISNYVSEMLDYMMGLAADCAAQAVIIQAEMNEKKTEEKPAKKPNVFKRIWNKLFK